MARSDPRPISAVRLDGGRLCIDFANTIHDRFAEDLEDYISTPERYLEWAQRAGAITSGEASSTLPPAVGREPLMMEIRAFRDAIYALLMASADDVPLPADALLIFNSWLKSARRSQIFSESGLLEFKAEPDDLYAPLKRIALDLVETITEERAGKLKLRQCANQHSCGWLFADTSKNGRRRWCAMETCGTISKMATRRDKNRTHSAA
jgi:predicted RNA-binding Zn ribbon-like protein